MKKAFPYVVIVVAAVVVSEILDVLNDLSIGQQPTREGAAIALIFAACIAILAIAVYEARRNLKEVRS